MCPSYLHMQHLEEGLGKAARRVALGAQDCYHAEGGAHTGAVTAEMLFDFGATWTLVGHSERRRDPHIGESDEAVALKARHATSVGLSVIACVGESAEERDAGHGIKVITRQLETLATEITFWPAVAIAYEPVWAINTGHIASLEHVQEARAPRPPCMAAAVAVAHDNDARALTRRCTRRCAAGCASTSRPPSRTPSASCTAVRCHASPLARMPTLTHAAVATRRVPMHECRLCFHGQLRAAGWPSRRGRLPSGRRCHAPGLRRLAGRQGACAEALRLLHTPVAPQPSRKAGVVCARR